MDDSIAEVCPEPNSMTADEIASWLKEAGIPQKFCDSCDTFTGTGMIASYDNCTSHQYSYTAILSFNTQKIMSMAKVFSV